MKKSIILFIILILSLNSCSFSKIQYNFENQSSDEPTEKLSANFFVYGLFQEKTIKVHEICKDKTLIRIENYYSFVDIILQSITSAVYTPLTIKLYCN